MVGFAADSEGVGIISKADDRLEETRDVTFAQDTFQSGIA